MSTPPDPPPLVEMPSNGIHPAVIDALILAGIASIVMMFG